MTRNPQKIIRRRKRKPKSNLLVRNLFLFSLAFFGTTVIWLLTRSQPQNSVNNSPCDNGDSVRFSENKATIVSNSPNNQTKCYNFNVEEGTKISFDSDTKITLITPEQKGITGGTFQGKKEIDTEKSGRYSILIAPNQTYNISITLVGQNSEISSKNNNTNSAQNSQNNSTPESNPNQVITQPSFENKPQPQLQTIVKNIENLAQSRGLPLDKNYQLV
jgi:hypothetical protein